MLKKYKKLGVAIGVLMTIGVGTTAYAVINCETCISDCIDDCATVSGSGTDYMQCISGCKPFCEQTLGCTHGSIGGI